MDSSACKKVLSVTLHLRLHLGRHVPDVGTFFGFVCCDCCLAPPGKAWPMRMPISQRSQRESRVHRPFGLLFLPRPNPRLPLGDHQLHPRRLRKKSPPQRRSKRLLQFQQAPRPLAPLHRLDRAGRRMRDMVSRMALHTLSTRTCRICLTVCICRTASTSLTATSTCT